MAKEDERSLEKRESGQFAPLEQVLAMAVFEFGKLPPVRQQHDLPYDLAYFLSEDGHSLVMLRRRRPLQRSLFRPPETPQDGYFAEVFAVDETGADNFFPDPSNINGLYQRIDVTDEDSDPYYGSIHLTPTKFTAIYRERFQRRMQSRPPEALPGSTDQQMGVLGELFAQRQIINVEQEQKTAQEQSVREEIIKTYFREGYQGLTNETGDNHFVITEDKNSPLVQVSRALGVATHVIKIDESWYPPQSSSPFENPLEKLRDAQGLRPMLISLDDSSFEGVQREDLPERPAGLVVNLALGYGGGESPLYNFARLVRDRDSTYVERSSPGWYFIRGKDPEVLRKFLIKVGVDFMLTTKVRELARSLT